jgi:reductive dehalogenase
MMNNIGGPAANLEVGKAYTQMATLAISLANAIASLGYPARAHHVRNYLILQVPVAIDAGMGELSRAGFVLHPKLGTNPRLVTVTTDLPVVYDKPIDFGLQAFCANCKICADACPSGAISKGDKVERNGVMVWDIDEVACLKYWGTNGVSCAVCQVSCPWTKHGSWIHDLARNFASSGGAAGSILAALDKIFYGEYSQRKDPDWLT